MSSLFGSLPPPTGQASKREAEEPPSEHLQEAKRPRADAAGGPSKNTAGEQEAEQPGAVAAAAAAPPPPPQAPPPSAGITQQAASSQQQPQQAQDQVAAALRKIASHIGHPKKFVKAAELLRQLFAQGTLQAEHGPLAFSALKAAMRDPQEAHDPMLAREYSKLFTAASKHAEVFTLRERSQLDVYGVWAVLRNQLTTDDSFQFNKVVGRLKEMASALPEADESDDVVLRRLEERAGDPDPILEEWPSSAEPAAAGPEKGAPSAGAAGQQLLQQQQAAAAGQAPVPAPPAAADPAEHDPFNLDALMEEPAPPPPPPPPPPPAPTLPKAPTKRKSMTWSGEEVTAMRRVALLDCIDTCKAVYRNAWARTSVDLLIEHFHKLSERFAPRQRPRLEEFMRFVRDQRRVRKLGPSAKELARDTTTFEARSSEWSKQHVSARGKLGGGADHKAEMWLG